MSTGRFLERLVRICHDHEKEILIHERPNPLNSLFVKYNETGQQPHRMLPDYLFYTICLLSAKSVSMTQ